MAGRAHFPLLLCLNWPCICPEALSARSGLCSEVEVCAFGKWPGGVQTVGPKRGDRPFPRRSAQSCGQLPGAGHQLALRPLEARAIDPGQDPGPGCRSSLSSHREPRKQSCSVSCFLTANTACRDLPWWPVARACKGWVRWSALSRCPRMLVRSTRELSSPAVRRVGHPAFCQSDV